MVTNNSRPIPPGKRMLSFPKLSLLSLLSLNKSLQLSFQD